MLLVAVLAIAGIVTFRQLAAAAPPDNPAQPPGHDAAAVADGIVNDDDGMLPDGATVFDGDLPGVANLSPGLRDALQRASQDAAAGGVIIHVNSGWRSAEYQDRLVQEAVSQYGSVEEAARWVASAATSAHVSGEAVDVGSYDAVDWLTQHGAGYGLCQTYGNEAWHFELRAIASGQACPRPFSDPTQDPRMQ